ncbi:acetyl-CoA hydrolase/transferase family protein [Peribacillus asahii]|uniref:4-hydroxybutyrate CoA-transferase n=1 Tax=Peribacillus asahii TaxID=228899 RepID=A0A3Q9RNA7_9BACI|nr:acetyl-CoA hydrolase/transferase C-terminal domain-containing protein [Peribacillus asahii]AZV43155.1 4-hydroxybutyrate CoA-transferase [Peribacillus asahii]USK83253.1 4-hydroxybutyrate CoA-transferase [Peribacillus asahii]
MNKTSNKRGAFLIMVRVELYKESMTMSKERMYQQKLVTAKQAVAKIKAYDDIIVPLAPGDPPALLAALEDRSDLERNRLFQMLPSRPFIKKDPQQLKVISMFLSAGDRKGFSEGGVDLLPNHFSDIPELLSEITTEQVVMATVSPMDQDGYFSLGTNCDYTAPMLQTAKTILLEVNEYMPRTYGLNQIHISEVDCLVENHQPLIEAQAPAITEKDRIIGQYIAELIQDGDSIQIGFGAIPNTVMDSLTKYKDLTIYTEVFPDKLVDLYESGAVTNIYRSDYHGKSTATFAFGTKRLYEFLHENPDIYMLPVNHTNNILHIAQLNQLVSINATVEIDFLGQCNSEKIGSTYWSSTGGQAEFCIGSRMAKGGKGIICLHSTTKNDEVSKIVPMLAPGIPVTTSKNDVDYVVTEHGVAKLRGKTVRERTEELIRIAHPKFREQLTDEAKKMGYLL